MTSKEAKNIGRGITDKIEATTDIDDWAEFWGFTRDDYEEFLEIPIKMLEQEQKWIPISERLPEDSGEYLVSVIDGLYGNVYKAVGIGWFAHKKDYAIARSEWRELGIGEIVVAWMPLPPCYELQEGSDKE